MRTPKRSLIAFVGCGALALAAPQAEGRGARQAAPASPSEPDEAEVTRATPEELSALLEQHRRALEARDAVELAEALAPMARHDNPELRDPALAALSYRASREDRDSARREADELGLGGVRKEIEAIMEQRVARVQAAAAWALAAQRDDERVQAQLLRTLRGRGFLTGRPEAGAAVIEVLGKLGEQRAAGEVERELKRFGDPRIQRACIRYFGWIETKDRSIVRFLCEQLDPPEPADVHSPTNPPASYWEERWRSWSSWRRDLTWALERITGETFQPALGDEPSDSRKALEWLAEHGAARGIR